MARPFPKQFDLTGGIICQPKLFPENAEHPRLIINLNKFRKYIPNGTPYFNGGIFLYVSQYRQIRKLVDRNPSFFNDTDVTERFELYYDAFIEQNGQGGATITIQSRSGPKSLRITRDQYSCLVKQHDKIEAQIEAFEFWIDNKINAEERATRGDETGTESSDAVQELLQSLMGPNSASSSHSILESVDEVVKQVISAGGVEKRGSAWIDGEAIEKKSKKKRNVDS